MSAGDVLLLSPPWPAAQSVVAGAGDFTGKIPIGCPNPLLPDLSGLAVGATGSAGELVAQWAPGAKFVKAFNSAGYNIMANADMAGRSAPIFYWGDALAYGKGRGREFTFQVARG